MNRYKIISKIGEGTFSEVMKIQRIKDGSYYASKKMKQRFDSIEQVNNLREIQALRRLSPHPNILQLQEVIFDKKTGGLALICELMDMNIYELIKVRRHPLPENKVKNYMYQLCKSLDHIHRNGIFHRDVKPENILIKHDILKLGDFGSCRSVYSKQPYTEYISTRWYRAPECLLTDGYYSYKMDMWSAGCVFFEISSLRPLFPGVNELDQISKIHDIVGTPAPCTLQKFKPSRAMNFDFPFKKGSGISRILPNVSPESLSFMYALVEYDPDDRISAKDALQHSYFRELRTLEKQVFPMHRNIGTVDNSGTAGSMNYLLQIARQGRRQRNLKPVKEAAIKHNVPMFPVDQPKLNNPGVTKFPSFPSVKYQSVFPTPAPIGKLPVLQTMKYLGTNSKRSGEPKQRTRFPPISRPGDGCGTPMRNLTAKIEEQERPISERRVYDPYDIFAKPHLQRSTKERCTDRWLAKGRMSMYETPSTPCKRPSTTQDELERHRNNVSRNSFQLRNMETCNEAGDILPVLQGSICPGKEGTNSGKKEQRRKDKKRKKKERKV